MKILFWSDVHCHNHRPFARYDNGTNSRLRDGLRVIEQVIDLAKDCDFSVFLGDLFHVSPPPAVVFNEVYDMIGRLAERCPLLMVAGNHDLRSQYFSGDVRDIPFLKMRSIKGVSICEDDGTVYRMGDLSVFAFNHRRQDDAVEVISKVGSHDILVMHQEVYGASNDSGYTFKGGLSSEDLKKKFRWVFNGHIHRPQIISERIVCVGAGLHIDFGDSGDRGVILYDSESDDITPVDTRFPRFVTLDQGETRQDDDNFYRPKPLNKKNREALQLPEWEDAVSSYISVSKVTEDKVEEYYSAAKKIVDAVPKEVARPQPFILKHISLRNFGVFEKAEVDVREGIHMVVGENENRGKSNGSGKTTLWEAVAYCVYGLTSKGVKGVDVMRRPRKRGMSCSVTLRFDSPLGELIVTRKQTASGSKLEARLGDHVESGREPEVKKWLLDTIGTGYEFFCQMVYFSQEKASFFSDMNDTDRKHFLGTLLEMSWYEEAEKQAKTLMSSSEIMIQSREEKKRSLDTQLESKKQWLSGLNKQSSEWGVDRLSREKSLQEQLATKRDELSDLERSIQSIRDRNESEKRRELEDASEGYSRSLARVDTEEHADRKKVEEEFESKRSGLVKRIDSLKSVVEDNSSEFTDSSTLESALSALLDDEKDLLEKTAALKSEWKSCSNKLIELSSDLSNVKRLKPGTRCPTCKSEITEESMSGCVDEISRSLSRTKEEEETLQSRCQSSMSDLTFTREKISSLKKDVENSRRREELVSRSSSELKLVERDLVSIDSERSSALLNVKSEYEKERFEVRKDDEEIRSKIEKRYRDKLSAEEIRFASEKSSCHEAIRRIESDIVDTQNEVDPYEKSILEVSDEIDKIRDDIVESSLKVEEAKRRFEVFEFWVRGFGREGIRAALLGEFCRAFTAEVNDVLQMTGVGLSAELKPARKLKSGETRDELEYLINTPTGLSTYKQLSGGEKTRVDLSSMLALNRIASNHFGIKDGLFGILILDEVFSSLDEEGRELTYQILQGFTARSVYVISHNRDMQSLFDNVITVHRSGLKSELVA